MSEILRELAETLAKARDEQRSIADRIDRAIDVLLDDDQPVAAAPIEKAPAPRPPSRASGSRSKSDAQRARASERVTCEVCGKETSKAGIGPHMRTHRTVGADLGRSGTPEPSDRPAHTGQPAEGFSIADAVRAIEATDG